MKLFKNRTVLGIFCIAVSLIICFVITPPLSMQAYPRKSPLSVSINR
ncbi:hypothetical protein [Acetivibrio ethanolgignens]|nr:hypothetical protein [Acetivibrio ethanolgignens]